MTSPGLLSATQTWPGLIPLPLSHSLIKQSQVSLGVPFGLCLFLCLSPQVGHSISNDAEKRRAINSTHLTTKWKTKQNKEKNFIFEAKAMYLGSCQGAKATPWSVCFEPK